MKEIHWPRVHLPIISHLGMLSDLHFLYVKRRLFCPTFQDIFNDFLGTVSDDEKT